MITTEAPRRRPILAIAIAFSVLLHLVLAFFYLSANQAFGKQLAALFPHPKPTPSVDQIELSDAIKLEETDGPSADPAAKTRAAEAAPSGRRPARAQARAPAAGRETRAAQAEVGTSAS